jgi:nucleoside-diphosphate-sugar epimerase
MNYRGKKVAITGVTGFIGGTLYQALTPGFRDQTVANAFGPGSNKPAVVDILEGDIRDRRTFAKLDHTYDYLFHFAAPSSQILFARDKEYCANVTLSGFINAARACKQNGIKLIYPSTGLLSSPNEPNEYAKCKLICEQYADVMNIDSLGIRIFATYGPGEGHKRDYASVPYLFARDMVAGRPPVLFGDGEQVRDFIYIEDAVQAILHLAEECPDKVVDVGSGLPISFNHIIAEINAINDLPEIKPLYGNTPKGYVNETAADPTKMAQYYRPQVTFAQGISQLVKHLGEFKS